MEKERCRGERRCKKDTLHGLRWRGAVRRKIMENRIIDTRSKRDVETYRILEHLFPNEHSIVLAADRVVQTLFSLSCGLGGGGREN